jgi:2-keto-3-deoxy-L-rhamnonate aldolase RhmA
VSRASSADRNPLGVSGYPIDYRPLSSADTVPALENTLVACMIETEEGLNNVEEIAAVPGVDVIHVGSNDLLTAMGKPGTYGSAEHLAAMDRVIKASLKHGKVPGIGGDRNVARQVEFIRKGVRTWRLIAISRSCSRKAHALRVSCAKRR